MTNITPVIPSMYLEVPGLSNPILLSLPHGKLPVCSTCKRSSKTQNVCRSMREHTALPVTGIYVCITLGPCAMNTEDSPMKDTIGFENPVGKDVQACISCSVSSNSNGYCRVLRGHVDLPHSTTFHTVPVADVFTREDSDSFRVKQSDIGRSFLCHVSTNMCSFQVFKTG
jgi:hypothetical protein